MSQVTNTSFSWLNGDRALQHGDTDKLGFRDIASQIATAIADRASDSGLVVGVEGVWGSGKSSLLFLIEEELGKLPEELRPTVINFRPWLVGNRDALLKNLFSSLRKAIDQVASETGDSSGKVDAKAKEAVAALRKFTVALSKAGALVEVAGDATAFAPMKWAGKGLTALRNIGKEKPDDPVLDELKEKLIKSLQDLGHRFIVTIDDVDRLEPKEVMEILRLTRSVADFPNVIYLLSYDSSVLAHSIEQAAQVENGLEYLEKIVQLSIMVPKPETFQLRQWFGEQLHNIASTKNEDELSRLKTVIDYEGGRYLNSPRSVVRVLDSIRFLWPALKKERADLADVVWLQLIKNGNRKLYRWIEEYCAMASVLSLGTASVDESERSEALKALIQSVEPGYFDNKMYRYYFAEQLPGLKASFADAKDIFELYQRVSEADLHSAISNVKLASPDHYRLYFAQSRPSHALTHADFETLWSATDAGLDSVETLVLKWHQENISGEMGKADLLLERLNNAPPDSLTSAREKVLLLTFSNALDQAYRLRPFDHGWVNSIWDRAEKLIPIYLAKLDALERQSILERMFNDGKAISWLSSLFRRETFAHGKYGSRSRPEADWLFTESEFKQITKIMLSRYSSMKADEFFAEIDATNILFAWQQGGGAEAPKRFVESLIETSEGLIQTLERLTSTITSSNRGKYQVLKRETLSCFLDYDHALARVNNLTIDGDLGVRATILARAFDDAKQY
jgi:hypothetical protein